jgi:hypothetical protein
VLTIVKPRAVRVCLLPAAAGNRDDEDPCTLSLGHWPRDGELGKRGVLPPRNGLERRAQAEVLLDIDTLKAR